MKKVVYYKDELNDDFAGNNIKTKKVPDNYKYVDKRIARRIFAFILYYVVAFPIATLFNLIGHGERIKNKKILKPYRKTGYFIYGNHTLVAADAFTPPRVVFPKKANVIVGPDAVSIPVVKRLVADLGGFPTPSSVEGTKKFLSAIKEYSEKGKVIVVYPEAHIWPYCKDIRPFGDSSFKYPAQEGKPVFCFTRTFRKRRFFSRPRSVVYVDGPFFPDEGLTVKQNQRKLRGQAYAAMVLRSALSDVEYVKYVKATDGE